MNFEELENAIIEIQQSRSNFQLERFVLGQHLTPEMQYYQLLLEIQDLSFKHKNALIEREISEKKIAKLESSEDEIKILKAKQRRLALDQMNLAILGTERELAHLLSIWESFEHKYSREEIEAAQPEYWRARLSANANAMIMGGAGINPAHLEAMAQAGILEEFIESTIPIEDKNINSLE
jgi:hypothetical protein